MPTSQPAPSRQASNCPSSASSWTTPKPLGQSKRSALRGSSANCQPSPSPSNSPARPSIPGASPTGAKAIRSSRPCACIGPPRRPTTSTPVSRACGAAWFIQARSDSGNTSASAAAASSAPASNSSASRAKRSPPATTSPSSTCSPRASVMRSCGASRRQPPSTACQRVRPRNFSRRSCGSLPSASGAPDSSRSCHWNWLSTSTTRWPRSCAQAWAWPRPSAGAIPKWCSSGAQAPIASVSSFAQARPSPAWRSKRIASSAGAWSGRMKACAPASTRPPSTRTRRSTRGIRVRRPSSGARTSSTPPITCNSPRPSR